MPVLRTALHALKLAQITRGLSTEQKVNNLAMSAEESEAIAESLLLGLAQQHG